MKEFHKILFIGGKGGVGKSTTAAAIAVKQAMEGKKTLLISTDPAHNVGHIFNQALPSKKMKVMEDLYVLEINPALETKKYIHEVKENMRGLVSATMVQEVESQLDLASTSPGADEAALFDKLISIMIEESQQFEQIIFDTAPTGHTVRLLTLPKLMGIWIESLLAKRYKTKENYANLLHDGEPIEDPIFEALQRRQRRFKQAREMMMNEQLTAFIFVLNPERLSIIETKNALDLLSKNHIHVERFIVNRVLPKQEDGQFFQTRKQAEKKYLQTIAAFFPKERIIHIPYFAHDMHTVEDLDIFASYIQTKER